MTITHKTVFSLLISAFLFAGIAVLAYTGIFNFIESRFYSPAVTGTLVRETARDAEIINTLLAELQNRFSSSLHDPAVRDSFLPSQDTDSIYKRYMIFGRLLESVPQLYSVRFVDSAGKQIHFSTYSPDIVQSDSFSIVYRDYDADPASLPFDEVRVRENNRLTLDKAKNQIIFSFPLHDSDEIYRGTALFTVSVRILTEALVVAGRMGADENLSVCTGPPGLVSGLHGVYGDEILAGISSIWDGSYRSIVPIVSAGVTLVLVSARIDQGIYYGRIVDEAVIIFSPQIKIMVLVSVFLTIFLIIFFFFNFSPLPDTAEALPSSGKKPQQTDADSVPDSMGGVHRDFGSPPPNLQVQLQDGVVDELEELEPIEESGEAAGEWFKTVSPFSSIPSQPDDENESAENDFAELEELFTLNSSGVEKYPAGAVSMISRYFAFFPDNPELLPEAGSQSTKNSAEIIFEQNGIHYINNDAFIDNQNTEEKPDNDFMKLIESVVDKV